MRPAGAPGTAGNGYRCDADASSCHHLNPLQAELATLLGWATGTPARLTDEQWRRLQELEKWALGREAA